MSAMIQIPVKVLDEKCSSCRCMDLQKQDLYAGADVVFTEYYCSNIHLCTYIRNRIVRNEEKKEEEEHANSD